VSAIPSDAPDTDSRRERLIALCKTLPGASAEPVGSDHLAFKVAKKIFAYYAYDHHGDGRIAFLCKAPPGEQGRLLKEDPVRYFVPPYVGPKGWVGLRLDTPRINWSEVKDLAFSAYVLTAPDRTRKQTTQGPLRERRRPRAK
jgi:hypothetical protein